MTGERLSFESYKRLLLLANTGLMWLILILLLLSEFLEEYQLILQFII